AIEPVGIAQRAEVLPDGDQRLLDRVLGRVLVAQDPAGDEEQPRGDGAGEPFVGVAVALLRLLDQRSTHDRPRPPGPTAPPRGALTVSVALVGRVFQSSRRTIIRGPPPQGDNRQMGGLSIVVLGAGVSGLSAALALARDGHRVTLVERDELAVGDPAAALASDRRGIPHFHPPRPL